MLKHLCRTAGLIAAASILPTLWASSPATTTTTPIKYVVVIFQENNSFDHYFGTYPNALCPLGTASTPAICSEYPASGESPFVPLPNTPSVNGITPAVSNASAVAPFRLDRSQALTCDNSNAYTVEQNAYNSGAVNLFPNNAGLATGPPTPCTTDLLMGYYDGNTVTALWNYAQYFAMSDNYFDTEFGVTEEGHQNLIAGSTHTASVATISGKIANGSIIANVEAGVDDCVSSTSKTPVVMTNTNVGDLLTAAGVTWGWFYGDFPQSGPYGTLTPITSAGCLSTPSGNTYNSHYAPFMYYQTTSNPGHLPPSSVAAIGTSGDAANHNYALADFQNALTNGNLPAVTFLKAPTTETGHPSNSTPLEEQTFLVDTINMLQQSPLWSQMAIFITYDDSDGWYDHVMPPIVNQSNDSSNDTLAGSTLLCGTPQAGAFLDRCGYGTRLPLLVISPYAKQNYVDHALTDTSSVLRFIEDNWNLGRLGNQSFDALAGTLDGLFDFTDTPRPGRELILKDSDGTVVTAQ
ncbi:MAG TPA: alkaline phosphatase family protein [Bryobacteraceae bacterium]|nr:alkaline phosphatase family protein [Bryobacteraceae bacterium]